MTARARLWWLGPLVPALEPAWHKGLLLHPVRGTGGATVLRDGGGRQTVVLADPLQPREAVPEHDGEVWALERGTAAPGPGPGPGMRGVVLWGRPNERLLPLAARLRAQGFGAALRADLVLGRSREEAGERADRYSEEYAPDEAAAGALLRALARHQADGPHHDEPAGNGTGRVEARRSGPHQDDEPPLGIPRGSYLVDEGTAWVGPGSPRITGGQWSFTFIGTPERIGAALARVLDSGVEACCLGGSAAEAALLPELIDRIEAG
ncbi:hypothetical protein SAMN05216223_12983 [Actinacidiphila yanglinensis]|uniref:Uncharacterized protein n=1 Tax=Actinacidiphila yanglinensis TaxID=310779 RepID=A0A1H6EAF8_9ACTN|nr:hypothetical protein [Actinacidiphila yanglinensis]SEG94223.1 hypothetical protein SAMN05216223_12983 [Actinacidiphila yanglinensis]